MFFIISPRQIYYYYEFYLKAVYLSKEKNTIELNSSKIAWLFQLTDQIKKASPLQPTPPAPPEPPPALSPPPNPL
jgi:hypothetical protein